MKEKRFAPFGKAFALLCILGGIVVCSCSQRQDKQPVSNHIAPSITAHISRLRAFDNSWEKGDKIGVFAVKEGTLLGGTTLYNNFQNAQYITAEGDGNFTPVNPPATIKEGDKVDYVAYYPYKENLSGYSLKLDLSDQSNPKKLDLLHAKSPLVGDKTKLTFQHQLSRIDFEIPLGEEVKEEALSMEATGFATEATFDLATATFDFKGERTKKIVARKERIAEDKLRLSLFVFPGHSFNGVTFSFSLSGKTVSFVPNNRDVVFQKGTKYTFKAVLTEEGGEVKIISDEGSGNTNTGTIPSVSSGERASYMEIPIDTRLHNSVVKVTHMAPDNWFAGGHTEGGNRRNYSICFSIEKVQPLWVAYPLYGHCKGSSRRTDAWNIDPKIAVSSQPDLHKSYKLGTDRERYSRGHMLASSARTATEDLNKTTFYYTNMVPQNQANNSGIWNALENAEQGWATSNTKFDTLYVVCGPIFDKNSHETTSDQANKKTSIPVPSHLFKVILAKENQSQQWHALAVKMPNKQEGHWYDHIVTVKELEDELGFKFFTHLDATVAEKVKSQNESSFWTSNEMKKTQKSKKGKKSKAKKTKKSKERQ